MVKSLTLAFKQPEAALGSWVKPGDWLVPTLVSWLLIFLGTEACQGSPEAREEAWDRYFPRSHQKEPTLSAPSFRNSGPQD